MGETEIRIRLATPADTEGFMDWGKLEGWNMGLHDLYPNHRDYPSGWLIAENGLSSPLGKLYCVKYPSGCGHIGYIIVDEKSRGMGIGTRLLENAISYLSTPEPGEKEKPKNRLVSLYSADDEVPFYNKLGFSVESKVTRMTLKGSELQNVTLPKVPICDKNVATAFINPSQDLDAICTYDSSLSGAYRRLFWRLYGTTLGNKACVVCKSKSDGKILGVGALRPFIEGWRVGPVYAESDSIAQEIVTLLLTCNSGDVAQEGTLLTVDIFDTNLPALNLFSGMGFTRKSEANLMVKSDLLQGQIHPSSKNACKIFSITSLDFN